MTPDSAVTRPELPRKPWSAEAASARTDPRVVLHARAHTHERIYMHTLTHAYTRVVSFIFFYDTFSIYFFYDVLLMIYMTVYDLR